MPRNAVPNRLTLSTDTLTRTRAWIVPKTQAYYRHITGTKVAEPVGSGGLRCSGPVGLRKALRRKDILPAPLARRASGYLRHRQMQLSLDRRCRWDCIFA